MSGGYGSTHAGSSSHGRLVEWTPDEREPWMNEGLCAQTDPEAFFPEKGGSTRAAKKICAECDVVEQCLAYALRNEERFGIWGGKSERERRKLLGHPPRTSHAMATRRRWQGATDDETLLRLHGEGMLDVAIAQRMGYGPEMIGRRRRTLGLPKHSIAGRPLR